MPTITAEQKVRTHKLTLSVWDERNTDDGIWVNLKDGYEFDGSTAVHEPTWSKCLAVLNKEVKKVK